MRVLLLAALLLAGCVGSAAPTPAPTPHVPTLELKGCANLGADLPVPIDAARAALPPGFEPLAEPRVPQPTAVFYVIGLGCEDARVDGVSHGPTLLSYVEIDATPPPEYRTPGVDDYVVPLSFAAPGAVGDALAAMRLGRAGPGTLMADALSFSVTQGGVSYTLRGATPQPAGELPASTFRVFAAQDHAVVATFAGATTKATASTGGVALSSSGDALLGQAQPASLDGFRVSGFDLTLTPVG